MEGKRQILLGAGITILAILIFYFLYTQNSSDTSTGNFLDDIREESKAGFDSLQNALNYENDLNDRIQENISAGDYSTAYTLMDSLPLFGKANRILLYTGMIYAAQKKYPEAIEVYNRLMGEEPSPLALQRRAEVFIKVGNLDSALGDYKSAYSINYDFSQHVAATFQLKKEKDSALKYYRIYLSNYPDDTIILRKVKLLLAFP